MLNPEVTTGKPVIWGSRLTVDLILGFLAHGATTENSVVECEGLVSEDIQACLLFASRSLADTTFVPLAAETR